MGVCLFPILNKYLYTHINLTLLGDSTSTEIKIISLELSPLCADIARQLIHLAGLDSLITVLVGSASDTVPSLISSGQLGKASVDFLFLDHVEELYLQDFKKVEEQGLFAKGAMVVADNVVRPGAPEYRDWVRGRKDEGWGTKGVRGLIWPGEFEVSFVLFGVFGRGLVFNGDEANFWAGVG
jgi:catechol O-methyltransferase